MENTLIYQQFDDDLLYGKIDDLIAALTEIREKFGNVELGIEPVGEDEYALQYCVVRPLTESENQNLAERREILARPYSERDNKELVRLSGELSRLRLDANNKYISSF